MNRLLDTHLLLWLTYEPEKLSKAAVDLIDGPGLNFFSAASIAEVAIKQRLGRADFAANVEDLMTALAINKFHELPIDSRHAARLASLPALHKDPFDRLLVAQAHVEGLSLLTSDRQMARYEGPVLSV